MFSFEGFPIANVRIIGQVVEQLVNEGLETSVQVAQQMEEEPPLQNPIDGNIEKGIFLWKEDFTANPQSKKPKNDEINNDDRFGWLDIHNQGAMPPLNISTPLVVGLSLYQQFLKEKVMWMEEKRKMQKIINNQHCWIKRKRLKFWNIRSLN